MALQAEQAVGQRIVALFLEQRHGEELALRLGHLAAGGVEMAHVHPVVAPLVSQIGLGLRDLVGVVRKGVVDAAAVDVQIPAQMPHRYGGALDVPARIAHAPRRIPLERLILEFRLGEPEHEVVLVALVLVLFDALAHADGQILLAEIVEHEILFQLRGVEIDVAARLIGIAGVQQLCNDADVVVDAVRRRLNHVGALDVEFLAVGEERVGIEFRDLHDRLVLAARALEHLVLALVRVGGQMAHVGDVHHALDVIARIAQVFFQNILHDVAAQIADVREVIHSGAAGVHLHDVGMVWHEFLLRAGEAVIDLHCGFPPSSRGVRTFPFRCSPGIFHTTRSPCTFPARPRAR